MTDLIRWLIGQVGFEPDIDVDRLPSSVTIVGNPLLGAFWLFMGVVIVGVIFRYGNYFGGKWDVLAMFAAGLWAAYTGTRSILGRSTLTVDASSVTMETMGLSGLNSWTEPLERYKGVKRYRGRRYKPYGKRRVKAFIIGLDHGSNPKRSVRISISEREEGWREKWLHYARTLRLPAIDGDRHEERIYYLDELDHLRD